MATVQQGRGDRARARAQWARLRARARRQGAAVVVAIQAPDPVQARKRPPLTPGNRAKLEQVLADLDAQIGQSR